MHAARALQERLESFPVVARRPAAAALCLATLHVCRDVASALHTLWPQPEAAEPPVELASLPWIGVGGLPPHRLPPLEERAGLIAGPAEFVEHVGAARFHRSAQVLDGEVGRVAGVFQFLRTPFHVAGRGSILCGGPAGLRSRGTLRPPTAPDGTRFSRPLRRSPGGLLSAGLAARLALLVGITLGLCGSPSFGPSRRLTALLLTGLSLAPGSTVTLALLTLAFAAFTLTLLTLTLLTLTLLTLTLLTLTSLALTLLTLTFAAFALTLLTLTLLTLTLLTLTFAAFALTLLALTVAAFALAACLTTCTAARGLRAATA